MWRKTAATTASCNSGERRHKSRSSRTMCPWTTSSTTCPLLCLASRFSSIPRATCATDWRRPTGRTTQCWWRSKKRRLLCLILVFRPGDPTRGRMTSCLDAFVPASTKRLIGEISYLRERGLAVREHSHRSNTYMSLHSYTFIYIHTHIEQLYPFNNEILSRVLFVLECATNLFYYDVIMDLTVIRRSAAKAFVVYLKGQSVLTRMINARSPAFIGQSWRGSFWYLYGHDSPYSHWRRETLNAPCTAASLRVSLTTIHVYIRIDISTDPHIRIDTKNKNTREGKNSGTNRNAFDVYEIHDVVVFWSFQAFSGYYYTMRYFKLVGQKNNPEQDTVDLYGFRNATAQHCSKTWDQVSGAYQFGMIGLIHQRQTIKKTHKTGLNEASSLAFCHLLTHTVFTQLNITKYTDKEQAFVTTFCFNAHYIDTLLTSGYGFTDATFRTIKFRDTVCVHFFTM